MKKISKFIFVLILFFSFIINVNASYFDDNNLVDISSNRKDMQETLKRIASLYNYKQTFTEYEQNGADIDKGYMKNDEEKVFSGTFNYRNFDITPFATSQSKDNIFDCSSFIQNVYMNAFGFSFSDYYDDIIDDDRVITSRYMRGTTSSYGVYTLGLATKYSNVRNAILGSGKGLNTSSLEKMGKSGNYKDLFIKEEINSSPTKSPLEENTNFINNLVEKGFFDNLQTGDVLLYRRTKEGDTSTSKGHVMLYVEGYRDRVENNAPAKGFIHATGYDFPTTLDSFLNQTSSTNMYGDDKYSVRYTSLEARLNYLRSYYTTQYITYIAILRPLDIVENTDYTNIYTSETNKKTSSNIKNLSTYDNYKDIAMQQYIYDSTKSKYINDYNNVDDGDLIYIKAKLINKYEDSNDTSKKRTITVKFNMPDTSYFESISCSKKIVNETTNKVTKLSCSDNLTETLTLNPKDKIYIYYKGIYKAKNNNEVVSIPGVSLYSGSNTSTGEIKFNDIHFTGNKSNILSTTDSSISKKLISYYGNNSENANNRTGDTSSFINFYKTEYNLDMTKVVSINEDVSKESKQIIDNVFNYVTNDNDKNYGYILNTKSEVLNKLVVNGLYGGTNVRGNFDGNRKGKLSFDYLEPGDIVVAYDSTDSYMLMYLGKYLDENNNEVNVTYYRSNVLQKTLYLADLSNKYLNKALLYDAYVVIRPSMLYDREALVGGVEEKTYMCRITNPINLKETETAIKNYTQSLNEIVGNSNVNDDQDKEFNENNDDLDDENDSANLEETIDGEDDNNSEEVLTDIPNTSAFRNYMTIIMAIITIILGISLTAYTLKTKDNLTKKI